MAAAVALAAILVASSALHQVGTASRLVTEREPRAGVVKAGPSVVIGSLAGAISVPRSFLGISTEYSALPLFERHSALLVRVLGLVRAAGEGPLILRVGGASADSTFWDPSARRLPRWAFRLTPAWFAHTASLLRRSDARLILDLNLITNTPRAAARVAAVARSALPRGSILAFEIGNEPDLYSRADWHATVARAGFGGSELPSAISPASYVRDYDAFARVLTGIAPNVPLAGPEVAYPALDLAWISRLLAGPAPRLGFVSAHLYPYSACADRGSPSYPTVARLLSANATAGLAGLIGPAVALARRAGRPLRVTELNSVTCGGVRGVSNSFATALWAPDALFELMRAGVSGVNVHVREDAINGAFALRNRGLVARPLLYGLILFARTLGPGATLVHVKVRDARSLHLVVWAVRVAGGQLHVLVIDTGSRSATIRLHLPARGPATVQRLLAPSPRSTSGVTLNGQRLGRDARWYGQAADQAITYNAGGYQLTMPAFSAALVSVGLSLIRPAGGSQGALHERERPGLERRS